MPYTQAAERRSPLRPLLASLIALVLLGGTVVVAHTQEATPEVALEQGVIYGEAEGRHMMLDIYRPPEREELRPAVLLLPGWTLGRFSMREQGMELAEAGYVAFAVDYRLEWPGFIDDAQLAVRWVRSNAEQYGVDPERVCAYGFSSVGQLAAMLAVRETRNETDPALGEYSSRVACAVDLAGPADLTIPDPNPAENAWTVEELGGTPEEVPAAYQDVSPVTFVDEESSPLLVIHGTRDLTVLPEHSRRLAAALQEAGVEVVFAALDGEDHFDVEDWDVNGPFALAFLDRHLQP